VSRHLEPGTIIPDFELPDENGDMHRLSELQGDNLMVLHLSRGEHCPRERMHHRELLRFHEWSSVAFTELVTIMPNTQHDVFRLKAATGAHWTFLSDEGLETRTHFAIDEYTDIHHDYAVVPHTVILSPGLVIEKVYVGYWFWVRPSNEQLWADCGEILARTKADRQVLFFSATFDRAVTSLATSLQRRAKLHEIDLNFHDLRHEAGSRKLEAGGPLHAVSRWLGHSKLTTTDTYLNATTKLLHDLNERVPLALVKS